MGRKASCSFKNSYLLFLFKSVNEKVENKERSVQPNGVHHPDSGEDSAVCDHPLNGAADAEC